MRMHRVNGDCDFRDRCVNMGGQALWLMGLCGVCGYSMAWARASLKPSWWHMLLICFLPAVAEMEVVCGCNRGGVGFWKPRAV